MNRFLPNLFHHASPGLRSVRPDSYDSYDSYSYSFSHPFDFDSDDDYFQAYLRAHFNDEGDFWQFIGTLTEREQEDDDDDDETYAWW